MSRVMHTALMSVAAALLLVACSPRETDMTAGPAKGGMAASAPAASAAQVSDVDVSNHVKTALLQADLLKGTEIKVVTLNGDVRLTGVLDTQQQIDEALRLARAAGGAHTIHDELTLKR
jgi:osmotically-inducible protein OsmY